MLFSVVFSIRPNILFDTSPCCNKVCTVSLFRCLILISLPGTLLRRSSTCLPLVYHWKYLHVKVTAWYKSCSSLLQPVLYCILLVFSCRIYVLFVFPTAWLKSDIKTWICFSKVCSYLYRPTLMHPVRWGDERGMIWLRSLINTTPIRPS